MPEDIVFVGCHDGKDFENKVVEFLNGYGFKANRVGNNDGGVDIVAKSITKPNEYTFNIQCKYFNRTVGKTPIQEVYTGTQYYGNGGYPVVITNNRVTTEARVYAKRVGVEVIDEPVWEEIKQVYQSKKIISPNEHRGLTGILLAFIARDKEYLNKAVKAMKNKPATPPTDKEQLKMELMSTFDAAEEYIKEAAYLQQKAAQCSQKAMALQKQALLRNLDYG